MSPKGRAFNAKQFSTPQQHGNDQSEPNRLDGTGAREHPCRKRHLRKTINAEQHVADDEQKLTTLDQHQRGFAIAVGRK